MLRLTIASLAVIAACSAAHANLADIAKKSTDEKRAKLRACWDRYAPQKLPEQQLKDAVIDCGETILSFSADEREGKVDLTAVVLKKAAGHPDIEIGLSLVCNTDWAMVTLNANYEPTISDKLENKVAVSYKAGAAEPRTEWWNMRRGHVAVVTGDAAKRFINEVRQGSEIELLVELLTPHRRLQASYRLENILAYRELHLTFCR